MRSILLVGGVNSPSRSELSQLVGRGARKTVSFALPPECGKGAGTSLNASETAMILKKYPTPPWVTPDMRLCPPPLPPRPTCPMSSKGSFSRKAEDADPARGPSGQGGGHSGVDEPVYAVPSKIGGPRNPDQSAKRSEVDEPIYSIPSNRIAPFVVNLKRPDWAFSSRRFISPVVHNLRANDMPPPIPAWHGTPVRAEETPQPRPSASGQVPSGFASLRSVASRAGSWTACIARDFAHGVRSSYGFVRSGVSAGWAAAQRGLAALAENIHTVSGAALMRVLDMALLIAGRRSIESGASTSSTGGIATGDKGIDQR